MATKKNFTSVASTVNFEFVRKGKRGLELVRRSNGGETVTPVQVSTRKVNKALVIGVEPRFVHGILEVF